MIFDTNLIVDSAKPEYPGLLRLMGRLSPSVSAVSMIEVLGYHRLAPNDKRDFETFFQSSKVFPITDEVISRAISLRQSRKMSLGDAIIGATALVHGEELYTRNVRDFSWIVGLTVINPIANPP